ncbi:unnamed protein product [Darwinula stevensoni]|uniref:HIG1 domain-containing protein n=1 Tax=Darwinula stevensoni TaxID=69355 RepID=A0A7R8XD51_9CRUS|nr:unnamed protein product [Darwinula stevensoni]CAG0889486.1 unnamed protein product [Darwinula stevensoni]
MSGEKGTLDPYAEEKAGSKFWRKAKEAPYVPLGITGALAAVTYSIVHYRHRHPEVKPSVYVIHTRLAAQGFVIAAMIGGICYSMFNEHFKPMWDEKFHHERMTKKKEH